LIEYDAKLSEVTFSSNGAKFSETRPARIGFSHKTDGKFDGELIEFVGENWNFVENVDEMFRNEPIRKGWVLRVVNPFESATFEPGALFRMVDHFLRVIRHKIYPRTALLRELISIFDKNEITLKIPGYNLFNPQKKAAFEKLLRAKYKHTTFIS
jgi:hypothetical protein